MNKTTTNYQNKYRFPIYLAWIISGPFGIDFLPIRLPTWPREAFMDRYPGTVIQ